MNVYFVCFIYVFNMNTHVLYEAIYIVPKISLRIFNMDTHDLCEAKHPMNNKS